MTGVEDEPEADSSPPPVLDTTAEKKSASPDRAALVPTETTETVTEEAAEKEEKDAVPAMASRPWDPEDLEQKCAEFVQVNRGCPPLEKNRVIYAIVKSAADFSLCYDKEPSTHLKKEW